MEKLDKCANIGELDNCRNMNIYSQKLAAIQPRTPHLATRCKSGKIWLHFATSANTWQHLPNFCQLGSKWACAEVVLGRRRGPGDRGGAADAAGRRLGAPDADRRDELPARGLANGRRRGSASFETPLIGSLILIRYP